eukprot:ANDGO_02174.mRNA.1 hypothetical protein
MRDVAVDFHKSRDSPRWSEISDIPKAIELLPEIRASSPSFVRNPYYKDWYTLQSCLETAVQKPLPEVVIVDSGFDVRFLEYFDASVDVTGKSFTSRPWYTDSAQHGKTCGDSAVSRELDFLAPGMFRNQGWMEMVILGGVQLQVAALRKQLLLFQDCPHSPLGFKML